MCENYVILLFMYQVKAMENEFMYNIHIGNFTHSLWKWNGGDKNPAHINLWTSREHLKSPSEI